MAAKRVIGTAIGARKTPANADGGRDPGKQLLIPAEEVAGTLAAALRAANS